jgi:hypothetical protein
MDHSPHVLLRTDLKAEIRSVDEWLIDNAAQCRFRLATSDLRQLNARSRHIRKAPTADGSTSAAALSASTPCCLMLNGLVESCVAQLLEFLFELACRTGKPVSRLEFDS